MAEPIFIPTPNWFISNSLDISAQDGSCALTAKNTIILTSDLVERYQLSIRDAHTKRLHCVRFHSSKKLLASCSEDLDVKIWDCTNGSLAGQHKLHQNSPSCLDWLRLENQDDDVLISCDVKGNIFKWDMNTNEHARYFAENKPITQVRSCPNKFIVAVGYNNGTIAILDVQSDKMKLINKLKNHEDSINCLCWYPRVVRDDAGTEVKIKESLNYTDGDDLSTILCSSSEDKTIRWWCTEKGSEIKCVKAPGAVSINASARKVQTQQAVKINYTPLSWPKPHIVISGSFKGELEMINLLEEGKWKPFTSENSLNGHNKVIYYISSYQDRVLTVSLDRTIIMWNMNTLKQETNLSTLNGYVYSISSSPIDPNLLAVSIGDATIKLFNEKHGKSNVKSISNNIKSEITQISWHPSKESVIAFGTKDGKVGIADVLSNKPAQYVFSGYNQSVYTLNWCEKLIPDSEAKQSLNNTTSYCLYSVADGKIMQHSFQFSSGNTIQSQSIKSVNFYQELKEFLKIEETGTDIANGLTEFAIIRDDQKRMYFAVGKFDGSIEIYQSIQEKKVVRRLCSYFNHQKLVTIIKWSQSVFSTAQASSVLMASGSNDTNVIVIDFADLIQSFEANSYNSSDLKLFSKQKFKLAGHKERITSLSWAKSNQVNILASSSFDSTVQIWNADEGLPLANFRGHCDKLLCSLFSSLDSNIVYSGGEDYCLIRWRVDEQTFTTPPEESQGLNSKKKSKSIKKPIAKKSSDTDNKAVQLTEPTARRDSVESSSQQLYCETEADNSTTQSIKKPIRLVKESKSCSPSKDLKSLFNLSSHGSKSPECKLKDCYLLYEKLYENESTKKQLESASKSDDLFTYLDLDLLDLEFPRDSNFLSLFGTRSTCIKYIRLEETELHSLGFEKWWIFQLWCGNVAKVFNELMNTNQMNDLVFSLFQLSINPSLASSPALVAYIKQLSKSSTHADSVHKSVLYLLCSYDITGAVEMYIENNMFTYALCLAQLRLPPKSNLLKRVLLKYAGYMSFTGDYETAALCFIRLGDFENAYKVLIRRNYKHLEGDENLKSDLFEKFSKYLQ